MSPKASRSPTHIQGKIVSFNISPKGRVEGALVETSDGIVQVNLPGKEAADEAPAWKVGARIDVAADPEPDEGDHPVFRYAPPAGNATGTITRLNYALHGEVNGWHLEDGTFIHVKPDGARKHRFKVGDRIEAHGPRKQGHDAAVLEPRSVRRVSGRS